MGCRRILRDGVRVLWFMEGLGALPARKKCFRCMALEPLVGARGGVRVCFYLLSTHLNGLASVLCVFFAVQKSPCWILSVGVTVGKLGDRSP